MGGKLWNLPRMPRDAYLAVEAEVRRYLDAKIPGKYRIPRYYGDKAKSPIARRAAGTRSGSGNVLIVHLRMTGKFRYLNAEEPLPRHAHAVFYLDNDRRLVFCDQRQFGIIKLVACSRVASTKGIRELAPEPFADEFSFEYLKRTLARSRRTLKLASST